MSETPPIRRDPDGLPFRPGFSLVSEATLDLMTAVDDARTGKGSIEEAIQRANEALDGGGDPCPPHNTFKVRPLCLATWAADTRENYILMAPLIERLAAAADQHSLNAALSEVVGCRAPKAFTTKIANTLQNFGAVFSPESGVLRNLSVRLAGCNDTQGAASVANLEALGWQPSGQASERMVMETIIQGAMVKTLNAWVSVYEKYDHLLPDTSENMSCMIAIYRAQSEHQKKPAKIEALNAMADRILLSGLVPWKKGAFHDWKEKAQPWVLEAAAEGEALRLERQTHGPAAIEARRKPRL